MNFSSRPQDIPAPAETAGQSVIRHLTDPRLRSSSSAHILGGASNQSVFRPPALEQRHRVFQAEQNNGDNTMSGPHPHARASMLASPCPAPSALPALCLPQQGWSLDGPSPQDVQSSRPVIPIRQEFAAGPRNNQFGHTHTQLSHTHSQLRQSSGIQYGSPGPPGLQHSKPPGLIAPSQSFPPPHVALPPHPPAIPQSGHVHPPMADPHASREFASLSSEPWQKGSSLLLPSFGLPSHHRFGAPMGPKSWEGERQLRPLLPDPNRFPSGFSSHIGGSIIEPRPLMSREQLHSNLPEANLQQFKLSAGAYEMVPRGQSRPLFQEPRPFMPPGQPFVPPGQPFVPIGQPHPQLPPSGGQQQWNSRGHSDQGQSAGFGTGGGQSSIEADLFIQNWLGRVGKGKPSSSEGGRRIKLVEARSHLVRCHHILSQLKSLQQQLTSEALTPEEREELVKKAAESKAEFLQIRRTLDDSDGRDHLANKARQTKKRREIQRKQRQEKRMRWLKKKETLETRTKEWVEQKQQEELQAKLEKEVQREVAEVLGAVKRKRAEVEEMTAMVTALADLRAHNREATRKKGDAPPIEADLKFESTQAALEEMLTRQMGVYEKEEHALRVHMKEEVRDKMQKKKDKRLEEGVVADAVSEKAEPAAMPHPLEPYRAFYLQAMHSNESMKVIRRQWDYYKSNGGSPLPAQPLQLPSEHWSTTPPL